MNIRKQLMNICQRIIKKYDFMTEKHRIADAILQELEDNTLYFINSSHERNHYISRIEMLSKLYRDYQEDEAA